MDILSILYENMIWLGGAIVVAVLAFFMFNYIRTRKLPPTDEPEVGEYRIEVDVGTHIVPFEGTLYYFNKLLNPRHFYAYAKTLPEKSQQITQADLDELKDFLQENAHFYAMRQGTKKYAFITLHHPIEISPFFKSEEGTGKKIVHATGSIGKETKGFQHITLDPINLSQYTLNPNQYETLDKTGKLLTTLFEKAPLIEEIHAETEKNRVMQSKVNGLADEVGKLKDEVEYWKYEAKRKGVEEREEQPLRIPSYVRKFWLYPILFVIGYSISPSIPALTEYHPAVLGVGLVILGLIGKKVLKK